MFIRSSTAINDCLISLDFIASISRSGEFKIAISTKDWHQHEKSPFCWGYESQEARDKAFDELCALLNSNYKLRDFT